ncbi:hypothetical protein CCHL11_09919 [Colletotrichum chlorophyti]|uniref:SnoaL-like domain-containing protein n=1 Tax=Colletotrichum chlorophyti TaxID=708187 RepID=A0A1Q8RNT3_9PEZI|nr:hypothetical protein CCHL11_09919 [Colletotrichum chlorophyti]
MASQTHHNDLVNHLKSLYASYRHTSDIDAKGVFLSPQCYQICRTRPSFAADNRETIIRYLHDYARKPDSSGPSGANEASKKGYYTIRPLEENEFEFGTDEQVRPAGFASAGQIKEKATREGWFGMKVDLWDETTEGKNQNDLLVKVQYWWTKEKGEWVQIFHDIMYMGPRDGTERLNGEVRE